MVICKILAIFLNTMTTDDNYSFLSMGILTQPIVMHLFNKQKKFFFCFVLFLFAFFKSRSILEHFEKKDDRHRLCISEITDYERCS